MTEPDDGAQRSGWAPSGDAVPSPTALPPAPAPMPHPPGASRRPIPWALIGFLTTVGALLAVGLILILARPGTEHLPDTAVAQESVAEQTVAPEPSRVPEVFGTTECPPAEGAATQTQTFTAPFRQCIDPAKTYTAEVETNMGTFTITFDARTAPATVNNFVALARNKFFENVICHRIIKDFVVQCGDPTGTGAGGPGYEFEDELPAEGSYRLGSVAMANAGPNTNGSQFFIITGEQGVTLPPSYSLFGQVTAGQDIAVDTLGNVATGPDDRPTSEVKILRVTITET